MATLTSKFRLASSDRTYLSRKPAVLPQSYDGLSSWTDWFYHFKKMYFNKPMEYGTWSIEFLVVSLRKKALQIFQYLPVHETLHFDTLVNALEEKFSPSQQCEMYKAQLRSRTKSPKESLQDLSFSIQRLSRAYPQASLSTSEEIAKDYFIDALPGENDMRLLV